MIAFDEDGRHAAVDKPFLDLGGRAALAFGQLEAGEAALQPGVLRLDLSLPVQRLALAPGLVFIGVLLLQDGQESVVNLGRGDQLVDLDGMVPG